MSGWEWAVGINETRGSDEFRPTASTGTRRDAETAIRDFYALPPLPPYGLRPAEVFLIRRRPGGEWERVDD